jgi:hypothetical protein
MGQRIERAHCRSRRGRLALWPMSPAARLSDQDINAALSDDPARPRPRPGPANRGAVRLWPPGSGGKGARSNPNFCGARLLPERSCGQWSCQTLRTLRRKRGGCGGVVVGGPQGLIESQSTL